MRFVRRFVLFPAPIRGGVPPPLDLGGPLRRSGLPGLVPLAAADGAVLVFGLGGRRHAAGGLVPFANGDRHVMTDSERAERSGWMALPGLEMQARSK